MCVTSVSPVEFNHCPVQAPAAADATADRRRAATLVTLARLYRDAPVTSVSVPPTTHHHASCDAALHAREEALFGIHRDCRFAGGPGRAGCARSGASQQQRWICDRLRSRARASLYTLPLRVHVLEVSAR